MLASSRGPRGGAGFRGRDLRPKSRRCAAVGLRNAPAGAVNPAPTNNFMFWGNRDGHRRPGGRRAGCPIPPRFAPPPTPPGGYGIRPYNPMADGRPNGMAAAMQANAGRDAPCFSKRPKRPAAQNGRRGAVLCLFYVFSQGFSQALSRAARCAARR